MGYMTYFSGEIQFSNKKSYYLAKQCFDHEGDSNFGLYESDFNDTSFNINICEDWKDYNDTMLSICSMALDLDKDVLIDITCDGEENDDNWEIKTEDKKLLINRGRIVYDNIEKVDEKGLKNQKYLQRLYDVTKDEKIMKELMLNKMENVE